MNKKASIVWNGILKENPSLRLVLGTCPTLAVTTLAVNGLGMGLAATFVLICSGAARPLLLIRMVPASPLTPGSPLSSFTTAL